MPTVYECKREIWEKIKSRALTLEDLFNLEESFDSNWNKALKLAKVHFLNLTPNQVYDLFLNDISIDKSGTAWRDELDADLAAIKRQKRKDEEIRKNEIREKERHERYIQERKQISADRRRVAAEERIAKENERKALEDQRREERIIAGKEARKNLEERIRKKKNAPENRQSEGSRTGICPVCNGDGGVGGGCYKCDGKGWL